VSRLRYEGDDDPTEELEDDPDWEPSLSQWKFEAVEWSSVAVWGRRCDEHHIAAVIEWARKHFLDDQGL
jgi:hypothetical protein